ncbi:uncharacterized protein LOC113294680 [Papaver somniferum]|uniref:uncharacterized protein LOC113294680 n=1 Tax=Papaver somniferum TaxID=3469 RepID=UPI000E7039E9|nr:uncharacterized protein LOC113294680 [Papaver somniferum]
MSTKDDLQSMKIEMGTSMQALKADIQNSFQSQLEFYFSNRDLNKNQPKASGSNTGGFNSNFPSGGRDSSHFHRMSKIDFSRFDGDNPKRWIQKYEYYFQMHNIHELHKTRMAAIYLDGKANKWYDNFCLNKTDIPWPSFCDNEFEYYKALLLSVHQDFPESYFIAIFIGGLKEELRSSVLMFDPKTLLHDFSLARMQEKTLVMQQKTTKPAPKVFSSSFSTTRPFPPTTFPPKPATVPSTSSTQYSTPKANPTLPLKRGEEAEEIFDQGGETPNDTDKEPPLDSDMEISLHALTGTISGDTIRIPGLLKKQAISILIDTACPIAQTASLLVTVANGDKTVSSGLCYQLECSMQGQKYCGDLRLLPLGGCDIVLGADWLKNLGDVLFNLSKLCITFKHRGKKIALTGVPQKSSLNMMSGYAVNKFFQKHSHGIVGQLFSIYPSSAQPTTPSQITNLIHQFPDVFTEPKTLPPERTLDHKIPLKPNSEQVNLRPYRCLYIQKSVVENLVKEMLTSGIIQPSHSPFASPILLVKNKDNSWKFCVDYKKLNNLTIKDKYPIPIIDELLDELHGSKFFSKIDLKSGYHQIRVSPSDIHKTAFRTHHGHFEFKVMPFCLTNTPETFQALMNDIFKDPLRKFILVFFDDILVYSPSLEDHLLHLQTTLEILRLHQLTTNFSKCSFGQSSIEYLGHIITGNGVMADPEKISAMVDWPIPTNLKAFRGFLGLTGYYRKFVQNCGLISRPLTDLLKKDAFS